MKVSEVCLRKTSAKPEETVRNPQGLPKGNLREAAKKPQGIPSGLPEGNLNGTAGPPKYI